MAKLVGEVNNDSFLSKSQNIVKGQIGEFETGKLLCKYLPEDCYVIAHPTIGKYDPDFIIYSPKWGFRIIEVKNWSIDPIKNIHNDGSMEWKNNEITNPLYQVKLHYQELIELIQSNYPSLINTSFGYLVVHYGFSRHEVLRKSSGSESLSEQFWKHHLFSDQLNESLEHSLQKAFKSKRGFGLSQRKAEIEKFINRITNNKLYS
ncbi:nuclease-related domain-containing protein, partial [Paenibacillus lupini]